MLRNDVLDTAKGLINGERQEQYGSPQANFQRIADMWNAYLPDHVRICAADVAVMMTLVKVARLSNTISHADSFVDAAGYLALGAELSEAK